MPPRKKREPSVLQNENCTLGWMFVEERLRCAETFTDKVDECYVWIQEALVEIKKTLSTPEIKLIPKTPSKKRGRGRKRNVGSVGSRSSRGGGASQDSAVTDTDSQEDSARPTRSTRARAAATQPAKNTGKSTRGRKAKAESETTGPEPVLSSSKLIESKEDSKTVSFKTERKSSSRISTDNKKRNKSIEREILSATDSLENTESSGTELSPQKKSRKLSNQSSKNNTPTNKIRTPTNVKSPITAIKTAIRAKTPINKVARSSPRSQSPAQRIHLPENSPHHPLKTIPNFSILNVKQKASAYEQHVHKAYHESTCSSSDDASSPRKRTRNSSSPRRKTRSSSSGTSTTKVAQSADPELKNEKNVSRNTLTIPEKDTSQKLTSSDRRSSSRRRSSVARRVSGVRSGVRVSLSRKRSSIMRHKLRTSQVMMSKQIKEQVNESLKSSPEKTEQPRDPEQKQITRHVIAHLKPVKTSVKPRKGYSGKAGVNPAAGPASRAVRTCPPTPRALGKSRSTRSKLRLHQVQEPPTLPASDSPAVAGSTEHDTADSDQPVRRTRSKIRQTQPRQDGVESMDVGQDSADGMEVSSASPALLGTPTLPTPPSSGEARKSRNTRTSLRLAEQGRDSSNERVSMSVKRPKPMTDESDEQTPPKRHCLDSEGEEEEDVIEGTPPRQHDRPRIVKPVRGGLHDSAQKKPANLNCSAVRSFIQRNTPQKKTMKELEEERRLQFESKNKEAERRLAKREEQQQRRRHELRKQREERQRRVENRRKEQEQCDKQLKMSIVQKGATGSGGKAATGKRMIEDRIREEKEKREKKMAEAEQRRKQVEDIRQQKFKEQEDEKRRLEDQLTRKRQEDERERMRRAAEQQRHDEERRRETEREREREVARKRAQEEEARRRAEAEKREREERDRRERAERERQELQRQQERERQRREERERHKEEEMRRLREERSREQERLREERETANMIKKHNASINAQPARPMQQQGAPKPKLNTSYTLPGKTGHERHDSQDSTDSYDMTPVRKKVMKKGTQENYCIDDIKSDDSTDEEDQPKKKIPNWAVGAQLKASLIHQYYQPPDLDCIFDTVTPPDLNIMFIKKRPRFNKRTSSAVWDSPILKPSGALPT